MVHLFWLILIPVITGLAIMALPLRWGKVLSIAVQGLMGTLSVIVFLAVRQSGDQVQVIGGWPQAVGIALRAELFSIDLVLLSTLLFLFMFCYNLNKPYVNKIFLFLFLVFQGLVNGIFLSIDLFNIFVFVELSTVVISLLIMFKQDSESIYDGMIYLMTNTVAMAFFLFGIGMLYKTVGAVDLVSLKELIAGQASSENLILPYAFLITAVSLKSALMPLFSWLPKAHGTPGAPSVVSAVLSGLYVKCGVYLFYRIQTIFRPAIDTKELFLVLGIVTAVVGFILAIAQKDIKLILAYHTVSQIGLIMIGLNMDHPYARIGALYHIINHALFKATLFLTAGLIIEHYQTRKISQIRGVWREMPIVAAAMMMAILGITGAPLFNGSMSKFWIMYGAEDTWMNLALYLVNLGTIVSFVKYSGMLWGRRAVVQADHEHKTAQQSRAEQQVNPVRLASSTTIVVLVMGFLCFLGGILSEPLTRLLFGVDLPIEWRQYGQKTLVFAIMLLAGALIYHGWLKRWRFFQTARGFELSLNDICLTIAGFFAGIVVVLKIWY
ncbi:MAG: proton-conducting transporter membrane subunit [Bacillota bacterium]|nr:proton-conducting transporter membrane subunit [Bacillota bacterium]